MQRNATYLLPAILFCLLTSRCQAPKESGKENLNSVADTTWAILPFTKMDTVNPVLVAGSNTFTCPILKKEVAWDEKDVFNPAAVVRDGKVYLLFRAEDKIGKYAGTSRIGLAVSDDGLHFEKMETPVLYPAPDSLMKYEWEGGIEDPRVVETDDGRYFMTYTAYDGRVARLMMATSTDLVNWTKQGTVLNGPFKDTWSKSGAVICKKRGERIVAEKIDGSYWMYFGDTDLFLASSPDLLHWTPLTENGNLRPILRPRPGYFDSRLVESGPYALMTDDGILLIYNGMNAEQNGDESLKPGAYCGGQVLFDSKDPSKVLKRLEKNFIRPEKEYETTGQINQVCFLEGLVHFDERWYLYYGTADSKIAVAVSEDSL